MTVYNLESILEKKMGNAFKKKPKIIQKSIVALLQSPVQLNTINAFFEFCERNPEKKFVDAALEFTKYGYQLSEKSRTKIPESGRLVIIANHPLGGLDGIAMLEFS
jgi:hypothetical protein